MRFILTAIAALFVLSTPSFAVIFDTDSRFDASKVLQSKQSVPNTKTIKATVAIIPKSILEKKGSYWHVIEKKNGAAVRDRRLRDLFAKDNRITSDMAIKIYQSNKKKNREWYEKYLLENRQAPTPLCTHSETVEVKNSIRLPFDAYSTINRGVNGSTIGEEVIDFLEELGEQMDDGSFKEPVFKRYENFFKLHWHPEYVTAKQQGREITEDIKNKILTDIKEKIEFYRKRIKKEIQDEIKHDDYFSDKTNDKALVELAEILYEDITMLGSKKYYQEEVALKKASGQKKLSNKFNDDPIGIAICSGSLVKSANSAKSGVSSRAVVTAAHCISSEATNDMKTKRKKQITQEFCQKNLFVFGYDRSSISKSGQKIVDIKFHQDRVFSCDGAGGVPHYSYEKNKDRPYVSNATDTDYAVISLNRYVEGIEPVAIATKFTHENYDSKGKSVALTGYPFGLPLKYTKQEASIVKQEGNLLFGPIDSHQGNSGGPLLTDDNVQIGILMKSDHQSGNLVVHKTALRASKTKKGCFHFSVCEKKNGNLYESIDIAANSQGNGDACSLSVGFLTTQIPLLKSQKKIEDIKAD